MPKGQRELFPEPILVGTINDFVINLNKFTKFVCDRLKNQNDFIPSQLQFQTIALIRRLLIKYDQETEDDRASTRNHEFNAKLLGGKKKWKNLILDIGKTFVKNKCDFSNTKFTDELISVFNMRSEASGWYAGLLGEIKRRSENWRFLSTALIEINKNIEKFCISNPDVCEKKGKGSAKLLPKLKENKNINFSDWLFIEENKLF